MNNKTIKEINTLYDSNQLTDEMIDILKHDTRQGVKKILKKIEKKKQKQQELIHDFEKLKKFDNQYKNNNIKLIAGIDEAGRGPLAGPVVAASVILPDDFKLLGLTDSKQINKIDRDMFFEYITKHALSYSVEVIDESIIDKINIYQATILAMKNSYKRLKIKPDFLLIDAVNIEVNDIPYEPIIKGDTKSLSIAAASILAKVTRDRIMLNYHQKYPQYKFNKHMGYGTKEHLSAIEANGITPIHRKTFSPIKEILKLKQ
ncbi:MAG TPA: ribonuclease HII [Pseudogracilibacillus sp.]|nr:ribonuclease HII [Pseudogracilibacillus sp.]